MNPYLYVSILRIFVVFVRSPDAARKVIFAKLIVGKIIIVIAPAGDFNAGHKHPTRAWVAPHELAAAIAARAVTHGMFPVMR